MGYGISVKVANVPRRLRMDCFQIASCLCVGGLVNINKKFVLVVLTISLASDYGSY